MKKILQIGYGKVLGRIREILWPSVFLFTTMERTKHPTPKGMLFNDISTNLIILPASTVSILLRQESAADLIALYLFYYYTAKWQKTNQPKATGEYCQNGLDMGFDRFNRAKKKLIELGLIESVKTNEGWFIRISFIYSNKTIEKIVMNKDSDSKVIAIKSKDSGNQEIGFQGINALNKSKLNALNKSNLREDAAKLSVGDKKIKTYQFERFWMLYPNKKNKGGAKQAWIKVCNKKSEEPPTWGEIKKAVYLQSLSEQWQDSKYIPLATTWLNQFRWLNDPKEMTIPNFSKKSTIHGSNSYQEALKRPSKYKPAIIIN